MKLLERAWYSNAWWLVLLIPASAIFGLLSRWRRRQYLRGNRAVIDAPVPVIVVGNISIGGTGKTPMVIALVKLLQSRAFRPGVVSRGYGASHASYPQLVTPTTAVAKSGDEALLIACSTSVPVVIDPDRPRAIKTLLDSNDCNIILSDDGLQHYAMGRQLELVVIDGSRGLANGRLLPAGPLREPPERLREADIVVVNGAPCEGLLSQLGALNKQVFLSSLDPVRCVNLRTGESRALTDMDKSVPVHAVSGIGNPARFFDSLQAAGFVIMAHSFPDHHAFQAVDLDFGDDRLILMTAKDAVKCRAFAREQIWVVEVEARLPAEMATAILSRLSQAYP